MIYNRYWLDYYSSKKIQPLVGEIADQFLLYLGDDRSKHSKTKVNKRLSLNAVKCFVCNSLRYLKHDQTLLSVSLDKNSYSRVVNGHKVNKVSYNYTRALFDFLDKSGYATLTIGGIESWVLSQSGWVPDVTTHSTLTLTDKCKELFKPYYDKGEDWELDNVLILRNTNKQDVQFKLNNQTRKMVSNLQRYNSSMSKVQIVTEDGEEIVDLQFKRIFNEDFKHGGRYYTDGGKIQCFESEARRLIKIDGQDVVELDYKAHHPRLAYTLCGIDIEDDFDPYTIEYTNYNGTAKELRDFCKVALLIMINCDTERSMIGAMNKHISKEHPNLIPIGETRVVLDALLERNFSISEFINEDIKESGKGGELQFIDSKITDYILDYFDRIGEVVIPIHDSYLVKKELKDRLYSAMINAYTEVVGNNSNCIIEEK